MLLQQAQQLRLCRDRQRIDLIEKQRSVAGDRHQPLLVAMRIRKRATRMAEHLALEQLLRQRRAVDRDERQVAATAEMVDCSRTQFLASPGLAGDENGSMAARHGGNLLYRVKERRMPAYETRERQFARQALMSCRFRPAIRFAAEKPGDAVLQFDRTEWSNNEVVHCLGSGAHQIVIPRQNRERWGTDRVLGEPVKEIVH